ncbi:signal recognition particle-docking protein FtsY [Chromatiales bacterium (ex Bugula neritina AB1)]|nr:signal recognition particle-docking protein FtsY [Chromatiales bacterium (ex Bugula neritina AB1)]
MFSFFKKKLGTAEQPSSETPGQATEADSPAVVATPDPEEPVQHLDNRLEKSRKRFASGILDFISGRRQVDEDLLEELESQLIMSDIGVPTASRIISAVRDTAKQSNDNTLRQQLREQLIDILRPCEVPLEIPDRSKPYVLLVVGVNGAGKTTTIGKIARQLQNGGKSVMLAAGDTFRAAAVEQLQTWGERNNIPVIAQESGADSASVIFDGLQSATARGIDVLIADTAGRLHTQSGLMDELAKVSRVIKKIDPEAPHETLLVLDGTTGQNGLSQAREFGDSVGVSGLAITKLDGTAKGGMVFTLADELKLPIRFIGVGEGIYDLRVFEAEDFVDALLGDTTPDGSPIAA